MEAFVRWSLDVDPTTWAATPHMRPRRRQLPWCTLAERVAGQGADAARRGSVGASSASDHFFRAPGFAPEAEGGVFLAAFGVGGAGLADAGFAAAATLRPQARSAFVAQASK